MDKVLKGWTKAQDQELRTLVARDDLFFVEIAERLSRRAQSVAWRARMLGLKKPAQHRYGKSNSKHVHLRRQAMEYFLTHSFDETAKRFGLTRSELKSLQTVSYKLPELAHLRKDRRTRAPYTFDDWLFIIRAAGVRERGWIGRKLGRSNSDNGRVIKERLQTIGAASKHLNGMPRTWATALWPGCALPQPIRTKAGPSGNANGSCRFLIIPWVECERLTRIHPTPQAATSCIRTMAKFQRFIHGKSDRAIRSDLEALTRRHR